MPESAMAAAPFDANESSVGSMEVDEDGEELPVDGASEHPHSKVLLAVGEDRSEYSGREVCCCVAKHDRIWNGESIDISK